MISRADINDRVRLWGLREDVVEKDYVLGWVLWGILMQSPSRTSVVVILALSGVLPATGVARPSFISRIRWASESQPTNASDMTRTKVATIMDAPFVTHISLASWLSLLHFAQGAIPPIEVGLSPTLRNRRQSPLGVREELQADQCRVDGAVAHPAGESVAGDPMRQQMPGVAVSQSVGAGSPTGWNRSRLYCPTRCLCHPTGSRCPTDVDDLGLPPHVPKGQGGAKVQAAPDALGVP